MNASVPTKQIDMSIKRAIETELPGAGVTVYLVGEGRVGGDALVEVVHPSFSESDRTDDQKNIHKILDRHSLGKSVYIYKLLTYKDGNARFNCLAHLHTVPSGQRNGMFSTTLTATDAYVFLAELDAAYLTYTWRSGGEIPFSCRAIAANKGVYASFPVRENVVFKDLEIQGQHHLIKSVKKDEKGRWMVEVNVGFLNDEYAVGQI